MTPSSITQFLEEVLTQAKEAYASLVVPTEDKLKESFENSLKNDIQLLVQNCPSPESDITYGARCGSDVEVRVYNNGSVAIKIICAGVVLDQSWNVDMNDATIYNTRAQARAQQNMLRLLSGELDVSPQIFGDDELEDMATNASRSYEVFGRIKPPYDLL